MRWWRWCDSYRSVKCPLGHHIVYDFEVPPGRDGFTRCNKRMGIPDNLRHQEVPRKDMIQGECGKWLYMLAIRGDGVIVCEVTLAEMEKMRKMDTPSAIISYLGFFGKPDTGAA